VTVSCTGIGVSSGNNIAIGESFLLHQGPIQVTHERIKSSQVEQEIQRFKAAVETAADQLKLTLQEIPPDTPEDIVEFIETHLLMLQDKIISESPIDTIRSEACTAEWALQAQCDSLIKIFNEMEDPYLRTRRDDVNHVVNRILKVLKERTDETPNDLANHIVLANDLSPADAILLRHRGIAGFVTELGGPMSHTAILARGMGIPALVGAHGATKCFKHGELLVLDAENGVVQADCDIASINLFEDEREFQRARSQTLKYLINEPARSRDGRDFQLLANIELPEDVAEAVDNGAMGIGLYRTEFLYMNRSGAPSEEEHLAAYRDVIESMGGRLVTIRTIDLGADKQLDSLEDGACNPALGLRAIRLCLKEPELFCVQLRAILRASVYGPIRIMIPMLTNIWEVNQVFQLLEEVKQELAQDGIPFDQHIPVGGMIEVPAAALAAASFARQLDFLSIGTNDLIQYTLAIDRVDDEVNYLYDPLHPAILQLIHMVIRAGNNADISVSMCGEMAGNPRFIPLLVAMGLKEFSMQSSSLLEAKRIIRGLNAAKLSSRLSSLWDKLDSIDGDGLVTDLNN